MILKKFNFTKITSTNDKALKLIKADYKNGIITSDVQTKGRGRYGKKWISVKGNLYMSIFFEIKKKISITKLNNINIKLVKKALQQFSKKNINIKKPNDLLINKKKICGILQETFFYKNKRFLIVGIGVNIVNSPKIYNYPTSYLNNYSVKKINKIAVSKYIKSIYERNIVGI
tara:strand:+ start:1626 stop:2144 length:519 start_codon:yes stop_codon:yes gene_type:complete